MRGVDEESDDVSYAPPPAAPTPPAVAGGELFFYLPWWAEADAEAVAGVGIVDAGESQADGAAGVAGDVKVIAAAADGAVVVVGQVEFLMAAFGVEVIQHNFPHATTHICHSESIAARSP